MFAVETYRARREALKRKIKSGVIYLPGAKNSAFSYPEKHYPFRQDSSFLYFFGLDQPGLAALIDLDNDREIVFGPRDSQDDLIWSGPRPSLTEATEQVGVKELLTPDQLPELLNQAQKRLRPIHFLPQYRDDMTLAVSGPLGLLPDRVNRLYSEDLVRAVVAMRSIKSDEEIEQMEWALGVAKKVHTLAMKTGRPGMKEYEVAAAVTGLAMSHGCSAFPFILTVLGQYLHKPYWRGTLAEGQLCLMDCGPESPLHYCSDITRTWPVSGRFSQQQKDVYQAVLDCQLAAIAAVEPGKMYREVHLEACRVLTRGLKNLGIMTGDVEEAVAAGAHALFMPHGIGHQIGMDAHEMEGLGEDYVGYDDTVSRSGQFGLNRLRMAKALQPGHVVTVEPGIYFNGFLIDRWRAENKFPEFIDYRVLEAFVDMGGVRIEDDVVVTADGGRVLGEPIPKTIEDVEQHCQTD